MASNIANIPIPASCPPISPQELQTSIPFYQGTFCNVYKVTKNSREYAVKLIFKSKIKNIYQDQIKRIYNQIKTLYSVKHEGVIELVGHFHNDNYIGLIFPMFGRQIGEFMREIKDKKKKMSDQTGILRVKDFVKIFRNIGAAVAQLHARGFVHRDITQDNVLIDQNLNTKLIDFGFVGNVKNCSGSLGTTQFLAPQIMLKNQYNHKVDIWSFGILLYQLLYGIYLFKPKGKNLQQQQLQSQYLKNMEQPIEDPPDSKLLVDQKPNEQILSYIKSMLNFNPDKRPQIGYLLSRKIFGAEQRQALTYSIEQYARQKTHRKTSKTQNNLNSNNLKDLKIGQLQETLIQLIQMQSQQFKKYQNLITVLAKQECKLAKAKVSVALQNN